MRKQLLPAFFCMFILKSGAQTYISDNFHYGTSADTLCGIGGVTSNWVPHVNAGTLPVMYAAANMTYSGYPSNANTQGMVSLLNGSSSRESINRRITARSNGTLFVSFIIRASVSGISAGGTDYNLCFNDTFGSQLSSNNHARFFFRSGGTTSGVQFGVSKASASTGAVFTTTSYSNTTPYLIVLSYTFNTGSLTNDVVNAWIITGTVPTTAPTPTLTATDVVNDIRSIQSLCLRQGTGTGSAGIDAIRVGTSWNDVVLPVTGLNLSAERIEENILLSWSTASEINNSHFEIQRNLDAGNWQEWEHIGTVNGNGTTNQISNYQFTDHQLRTQNVLPGTVYYRLKQVDYDGNFAYSEPVRVSGNREEEIKVFPNPFVDEITLSRDSKWPTQIDIYDMFGNLLHKEIMQAKQETAVISFKQLQEGIYLLKIDDQIYKLIKGTP